VGNDPTIGGPTRVAARVGPFLAERCHHTDSRWYKGGQRRKPRRPKPQRLGPPLPTLRFRMIGMRSWAAGTPI